MIRHVILMAIGLVLLIQGLIGKTRAKTIGRIPLLTASAAFLLESAAGTLLNKNLYLLIAFIAIAISLLVQSFVEKRKRQGIRI